MKIKEKVACGVLTVFLLTNAASCVTTDNSIFGKAIDSATDQIVRNWVDDQMDKNKEKKEKQEESKGSSGSGSSSRPRDGKTDENGRRLPASEWNRSR